MFKYFKLVQFFLNYLKYCKGYNPLEILKVCESENGSTTANTCIFVFVKLFPLPPSKPFCFSLPLRR